MLERFSETIYFYNISNICSWTAKHSPHLLMKLLKIYTSNVLNDVPGMVLNQLTREYLYLFLSF
jgi:hypothetical protein